MAKNIETNLMEQLYEKIKNCNICPLMDNEKALRNTKAVSALTDVFIISQSLAENQLRKSGVNFFSNDGKLGSTGRELEKFLNLIGRTVFPANDILLSSKNIIPKNKEHYLPVYNTEIAQCFPGKAKKGDRAPEIYEIKNCLDKEFIFKEINLIKPKILLLMGVSSTNTFFDFFVKKPNRKSLSTLIEEIVENKKLPQIIINNETIFFAPIQHASGLNPNYNKMLKNLAFIEIIKSHL